MNALTYAGSQRSQNVDVTDCTRLNCLEIDGGITGIEKKS